MLNRIALDREIKKMYREAEDLIRERAARKVPPDVVDSYLRAWLRANEDDYRLPVDDKDAEEVAVRAPSVVVWAYGGYFVQQLPWC
jgi:16S rRNA C967 or C1407 C5-methylase (RsmB/RsmF family)